MSNKFIGYMLLISALALSAFPAFAERNIVLVPINPGNDISGAWELNSATLPEAKVNELYSYPFLGLISKPSYSGFNWSSTLPPSISSWATLNPATGVLSGTPTSEDSVGTNFTITATRKGKNQQTIYTLIVAGSFLEAVQISSGVSHTCAVTTSGGAKCWGNNYTGKLGDGTNTDSMAPVDVIGLTSGVASISASWSHTCAVTTSGGAKCWGGNDFGQLGDGTTTENQTPVDVIGLTSGISSISSGSSHTCALTTSGGAKCWGNNGNGNLGDNTTTQRLTPVNVSGLASGVASISSGRYFENSHTCAVTTSGGAKCWGNNYSGKIGDGTTTHRLIPVDVTGLTSGVASISSGGLHTCALTTSGGAKCWGSNDNGRLGDGTISQSNTAVDVSGLTSGVASIVTDGSHTCALTTIGGAKCWGFNAWGQLGDGSTTQRLTPVDVSGLTSGVSSISTGNSYTCALTTSGGGKCWGNNGYGQLGDGTTTMGLTPVDVK